MSPQPKLSDPQIKLLLRVYRQKSVTCDENYRPLQALVLQGLARPRNIKGALITNMNYELTREGADLAASIIQKAADLENERASSAAGSGC
jgi:hypothetical protein